MIRMKSLVLFLALTSYVQNCLGCSCFNTHPQTNFCHAGYVIRFDVLDRSFVLRDYDFETGKTSVIRILKDDEFAQNFRSKRSVVSEDSDQAPGSITHVEIPSPPEMPPIPDIPVINGGPPMPPTVPEVPEMPDEPEWDPEEIPPPLELFTTPELPTVTPPELPTTTEDPYLWFRAEAMYTLGNIRVYKGEELVESLMSPGKTIKGFSALDSARCGTVLSVGETYYYMGSSHISNNEIEFSICSFMVSKSQELKTMERLSHLKKNLVYNWPKACNSSCTVKTECYYYCPEVEDTDQSLVCDEQDLHDAKPDAWNMEAACMKHDDICQWSVGDEVIPVVPTELPTGPPKLVPSEKVPPSNEIFLLTPPDEEESIKSLSVEPQIAILEIDSKSIKSNLPFEDPEDDSNALPPFPDNSDHSLSFVMSDFGLVTPEEPPQELHSPVTPP